MLLNKFTQPSLPRVDWLDAYWGDTNNFISFIVSRFQHEGRLSPIVYPAPAHQPVFFSFQLQRGRADFSPRLNQQGRSRLGLTSMGE